MESNDCIESMRKKIKIKQNINLKKMIAYKVYEREPYKMDRATNPLNFPN